MLRQRSISAIGVVLVAAVPAFIGGPVFVVAMLLLTILGLREIFGALTRAGHKPFRFLGYLGAGGMVIAAGLYGLGAVTTVIVLAVVLGMLAASVIRLTPNNGLTDWSTSSSATLYVGLSLTCAVALRQLDGPSDRTWVNSLTESLGAGDSAIGLGWFGLALSVTWLTDTAAYLAGRSFGTTKLIPQLSPGKTREGAIAGLIAGTLTGIAAALIFGVPIHPLLAGAVGLLIAIASELGDLGESLIKRNLAIKDMGNLIPGHGGLLDRIDALLFTLPLAFALAMLLREVR